jgi:hypothetical protein
VLGFGGAGGGGKSDLLLGLAATQHHSSAIFRRVFPNLRALIERSREIVTPADAVETKGRFNESLHRWMLEDGRMIEFEACQYERDKEKQRGRPRDFYGFDEVTEFTRTQFEFITAWLRSTRPGQRCRVVMTFNPPTDDAGGWVVDYFLPWLAYLHPETFTHSNPAAPRVCCRTSAADAGGAAPSRGPAMHPRARRRCRRRGLGGWRVGWCAVRGDGRSCHSNRGGGG